MLRDIEPLSNGGGNKGDKLASADDQVKSLHEMWSAQEQLNALVERDIENRTKQAEIMEQLKQQGQDLADSLRTPQEQLAARLETINELYQKQAIDAETAGRAQIDAAAGAAQQYLSMASTITGALTQVFENSKTAAIANAVMNTAEAITSALRAPWPLSLGYAAAAAASGYAQIAKIRSTSRSGGASAPSVGGGSAPAAAAPQQQGASQTLFIRGLGTKSLYSDEMVSELLARIVDAQRDGYQIQPGR
jgi:hypothetical protein